MEPGTQILYPGPKIDNVKANKMVDREGYLPCLGDPEVNTNDN